MNNLFQQIINLLILPPGNLVYHLVLAFLTAAALQAALFGRRSAVETQRGRLIFGLSLILVAQLALFASSGLAWQQLSNPQRYLPPLDRIITAFSIVWIAWLWCFPSRARLADSLTGLLSLAAGILALFTMSNWLAQDPSVPFNGSFYDWGWELFSLSVAFIGIMILLIRRPPQWETGFFALGILVAGFVANLLVVSASGDFSGIVRLAQICAYPLLPLLAQRLWLEPTPEAVPPQPSALPEQPPADARILQVWEALATERDPEKIWALAGKAAALPLHADLGIFLLPDSSNQRYSIEGGYDLVADEPILAAAVEAGQIPTLAGALQRGLTQRLGPGNGAAGELDTLARTLGLEETGSLLAAPLSLDGQQPGAGILLLSPYGKREWTIEDQKALQASTGKLARVLQRSEAAAESLRLKSMQAELDAAQQTTESLRQENLRLGGEILQARRQAEDKKPSVDLQALLAVQAEAQETITRLQTEIEQLRKGQAERPVEFLPFETGQLEAELRMTLEEIAYLRNQLAEANMKILDLQQRGPAAGPEAAEQQARVTSISQELRQPMTSLNGYADLLLAGSAGELTPGQRNFLERMKSAAERMRSMVDDLVRMAALTTGPVQLDETTVDLSDIVDNAVAANTALLREKNIALRVDLADPLPQMNADHDALRQILVDLLRNAATATPPGGSIKLSVSMDTAGENLFLSVADNGGGFPEEDRGRIFNPIHRASDPLIPGAADGGFGLSVVHALVTAHGGQIAAETTPGKTAAYTVRLPIQTGRKEDSAG